MAEPPLISLLHLNGGFEMTVLPPDGSAEPAYFREEGEPATALKSLLSAHPQDGDFETALPASDVMMMVLTLPATEPAEIDGMVQLQAEEISPFPPERTSAAWEILDQNPPQSRVLMALCARKGLDRIENLYAARGHLPKRVDVDILGWLELLTRENRVPADESGMLLILQEDHSYLVALDQGQPCLIRSMVGARGYSRETLQEELTMLTLSLETSFALNGTQSLQVWYDGEAPAWTGEKIDGWIPELHPLDELPPLTLGLARRGLKGSCLDLAPAVWKEEEARKQSRRKNLRLSLTGGGIWLALMLGFLGWAQYRQSGLRSLEKMNAANAAAVTAVQELSAQVRSLTQFTDRSSSALETLLILARATPGSGNLIMEDYRYDKEEGVVFNGTLSGDVQPFYQFLENLSAGAPLRVKNYDLKEARRGFSFQVEAVWAWMKADEGEETP